MLKQGKEAQKERGAIKAAPRRPATSRNRRTGRTRVKMQMGEETLLAFSYLFVPLLVLGMEGEREKENRLLVR